ncbi:MAG: tetratricopeptide repeat protein [Deltaproteobacteria bacterium]|nr:MAG: tetratricopeptide repeat protein [Deltaproteobacteria bacterium]
MASNTDGNQPGGAGGRPPRPKSFHVRRASGHILGPFSAALIQQMIRSGKLTGEEGISQDKEQWVPIVAAPEFATVFEESGAPVPGMATADSSGARSIPEAAAEAPGREDDFESFFADDDEAPAEQDADDAAFPGFWQAGGAEGGSGPELRLAENTGDVPAVSVDDVEPVPRTMLLGDQAKKEEDIPLPAPRSGIRRTSTIALTAVSGGAGPPDLPAPAKPRTTGIGQRGGATMDLPGSLLDEASELPAPVGSTASDLPAPVTSDLPAAIGGRGGATSDLPVSTTASSLPGRPGTADLPASGRPPQLPRSAGTADLPAPRAATGASPSGGTSPIEADGDDLDALEEFDSFFADDSPSSTAPPSMRTEALQVGTDVLAQPAVGAAPPAPEADDEDDLLLFASGDHPAAAEGAPDLLDEVLDQGAGTDEFAEFFAEASAGAAAGAEAQASASAPASGARPRASVSPKVIGAAAVLLLLVIIVVAVQLFERTRTEAPAPVAAAEPAPAAPTVELGDLADLRDGSFRALTAFMDDAEAVGNSLTADERARTLVAGSWLLVEYPELQERYAEFVDRQFELLSTEEPSDDIQMGRGAWLALHADEDALTVLGLLRDGEHAAMAELLRGFYAVQRARGVTPPVRVEEPTAAPDANDGSDEADEEGGPEADSSEQVASASAATGEPGRLDPLTAEERETLLRQAERAFQAAARADDTWVVPVYWRARSLLERGDVEGAYSAAAEALALRPEHAGNALLAASIDLRRGNIDLAEDKALGLVESADSGASSRQESEAFGVVADAASARFQRETAQENLAASLRVDPTNTVRLRQADDLFTRAQDWSGGLLFADEVAEHGVPELALRESRTRMLAGMGRLDEAADEVEAARRQEPEDSRFILLEGLVAEGRTQFDRAAERYRQALQIEPELIEAELRLADLERRGARRGEALARLERVSRAAHITSRDFTEIGERYLALGDTNAAIGRFNRAVELDRSNAQAWLNLIEFFVDGAQYRRALDRIDQMRRAGIEHPVLTHARAKSLLGLGEYDGAIEAMLGLIAAVPEDAEYLRLLGEIHLRAGNHSAAREVLGRARDLAPSRAEILFWFARLDIESGRYSEAISRLSSIDGRGDPGEVRFWLGVALQSSGQVNSAQMEFTRAINTDPKWSLRHPDVFYRRARLFSDVGNTGAAYADARTVLTLEPRHAGARAVLGWAYRDMGRYAQAVEELEESLRLEPQVPKVHHELAVAYARLRPANNQAAARHFEAAREAGLGNERPRLHQQLGAVYEALGRRSQAVGEYRRYLELLPDLSYEERRVVENTISRLGGGR